MEGVSTRELGIDPARCGERLFAIMVPQTQGVADYLLKGMSDGDIAKLDEIVTRMISRLEATDDEGNSSFLEETKPGK